MESNILEFLNKCKQIAYYPGGKYTYYDFTSCSECQFHCNKCADKRNMAIENLYSQSSQAHNSDFKVVMNTCAPLVFRLTCLQCKSKAYLVIYKNEDEEEYKSAMIYENRGGCSSKNAPNGVKYYLNQAYQSRNVGAQSASMAMYRAAMDFLLQDQGYTQKMLGNKIEQLEKDIANKEAPKWALEIDVDYIKTIKEIGNTAIHPNDGNIDKQKEIDSNLLDVVDTVFAELLDKVYEQPKKAKNNLEVLKGKLNKLQNRKESQV